MKKQKIAALVSGLLVAFAVSTPAARASQSEWSGWIVDARCGASNANAKGKACVLACYKSGQKLVLYVGKDQPLLGLDNQQLASQHVGSRVRVTAERQGDQLQVKSIQLAGDAAAAGQAGADAGRH